MKLVVRSKNITAQPLKRCIEVPIRTVLRLGSTTKTEDIFPKGVKLGSDILEINTPEACINSGNKLKMKACFDKDDVRHSIWKVMRSSHDFINEWERECENNNKKPYPAIIKHKNSCQGKGIYYIETKNDLISFIRETKNVPDHIIEKYYKYNKEYRLHVNKYGCFYACRKMLRNDAEERWHRHDVNSVWIIEDNPLFERPNNWPEIVNECIKAMNSVGLDICACDVKVTKDRINTDFVILETNSAPSLGEVGILAYKEMLPAFVERLINE